MGARQRQHLADEVVHEAGEAAVLLDLRGLAYEEQVDVAEVTLDVRARHVRQVGQLDVLVAGARSLLLLLGVVLVVGGGGGGVVVVVDAARGRRLVAVLDGVGVVVGDGETAAGDDDHGVVVVVQAVVDGEVGEAAALVLAELVLPRLEHLVAYLVELGRIHLHQ